MEEKENIEQTENVEQEENIEQSENVEQKENVEEKENNEEKFLTKCKNTFKKNNYFWTKIAAAIAVVLLIIILIVSLVNCNGHKGEPNGKHEHTMVSVAEVDAICTTDGTKAYYKCSTCDKLFTDDKGTQETTLDQLKINALGHNLIHHDAVAASCTTDGNAEYWSCSVCNKLFKDSEGKNETTLDQLKINALGHTETHHSKVNPTKNSTGTIEYWSCSRCSKNYSDLECVTEVTDITIPAIITYTSDNNSLYFGSYPQTKVTDNKLISTLNTTAGTLPTSSDKYKWTDYGYYVSNKVSSYMYYIDIDQNKDGTNDYRGVYFTQYRPNFINSSSSDNYQSSNSYSSNTVYWFKYEPIKWNILKKETNKALIISELLLDSQDFNYTFDQRSNISDYQNTASTGTIYSNNYMYSHIRSWLNTTFYDTAFDTLEKQIIETTLVDNSGSSLSESTEATYICSNTNDKIFLLSFKEANTYYSSNTARQTKGSDYAKSQGIYVDASSGNSHYWLRTPYVYQESAADCVHFSGNINSSAYVNNTSLGVRAACWINL